RPHTINTRQRNPHLSSASIAQPISTGSILSFFLLEKALVRLYRYTAEMLKPIESVVVDDDGNTERSKVSKRTIIASGREWYCSALNHDVSGGLFSAVWASSP